MEKSELIAILKDPMCSVMKEKKILASILIAESICILFSDEMSECYEKLIRANNPMAIKVENDFNVEKVWNSKNRTLYRVYNSLEEGISNYITLNEEKFNAIKEVYDYDKALSKLSGHFYKISELKTYINAYQLYEIDKMALKQIYVGNKNIVEVSDNSSSVDTIKKITKSHDGYSVGKTKIVAEKEEKNNISKNFKKGNEKLCSGDKISVHRANLYKDNISGKPIRSITGVYYLYNGTCKYNRYAIVSKKEYVGKWEFIIGYIDKDQIISVAQ